MLKQNQKGAVDMMFIILLVVVAAVGGFLYWRISSANETQPVSSTVPSQQKEETEETSTSSEVEEDLFSITLPSGWVQADGSGSLGETGNPGGKLYKYIKGENIFTISVEPGGGSGVDSDISGRYELADEGSGFAVVSLPSELCAEGEPFCDAGNDSLTVFIKQSDSDTTATSDGYRYNFYLANSTAETPDSSILEDLKAMIESIKLSN